MISISSVVSSPSSCMYYEVIGKFEHVVCELIFHDKLTLTSFFVWASIVATHFVICIYALKVQYLCDITASLIYYSFVDFFKSYLRFVCTCVFAPTQTAKYILYITILPIQKAEVAKIEILSEYISLPLG